MPIANTMVQNKITRLSRKHGKQDSKMKLMIGLIKPPLLQMPLLLLWKQSMEKKHIMMNY
jgi:hypothetical protein